MNAAIVVHHTLKCPTPWAAQKEISSAVGALGEHCESLKPFYGPVPKILKLYQLALVTEPTSW